VGERELLWGLSCFGIRFSQGVISGGPLVFGFLRYRPKPRSLGSFSFPFLFLCFYKEFEVL
jgi:hypothetical protein